VNSDAFVVGEDWISEHYFTTDAKARSFGARVLERRKQWDELAAESIPNPRSRFLSIRADLSGIFATLAEQNDSATLRERIYAPLRGALGYSGGNLASETTGPLTIVRPTHVGEGASVAVIEAVAVDQFDELLQKDLPTLLEKYESEPGDSHPLLAVPRLLSALFVDNDGPEFAIVFSGGWVLLTDKERWPEGRYLAIDLQLVADRNQSAKGGELDRAVACLAAQSLLPNEEGSIWWHEVRDESVAHTVGVSQDLREGVRRSIEIIANDVVARRVEQGFETLPKEQAQPLALQSLRYLYRILFLLFAEASPELEVVPANAPEYEAGYGLGRLRELVLVELSHDGVSRRHFHDSLAVLFDRVESGHHAPADAVTDDSLPQGLTFNALRADLFAPAAIALIDEVGLSDGALQRVLAYLLLSRQQGGRDRGYISYANLGINQLGAVYEGLMSYTGFFAETDLYEVAKEGDSSKGSWVVPIERSHGIDAQHFVQETDPITGEKRAALHPAGSFVYRLAGRERQQSASYYTPEILTKFVVSQALEELLDQNDKVTPAADILTMTVCEPALGSGAFAIEAVRQLADQYLARRQAELGERIDPDAFPLELQRVKASIALHQVYGVDLNSTAVELAEISLWLDTMVAGLGAPWFGLHLRRGNSLIGARRAVYSRDQITSKAWLKGVPRDVSVAELAENLDEGVVANGTAGAVHHFLLPADGWGSAVDAKEVKELAPKALADLKQWRRTIAGKPSKKQTDQLVNLAYRVESLWQLALRRLQIAEKQIRRSIPLWGAELPEADSNVVTREEIEATLADANGAYQRLKRVMDAWNALWFWPLTTTLTEGAEPPKLDEWIDGLTAILGVHFEAKKASVAHGAVTLGPPTNWRELGIAEKMDLDLAGARDVDEVLADNPWLGATERIAAQQGFFHWQLEFATVFERGGFDMQVGNPPWVRPRSDVEALLAEGDPWWQLAAKTTSLRKAEKRKETLMVPGLVNLVVDEQVATTVGARFLSSVNNYPTLQGLQTDLYRCFMALSWSNSNATGVVALIHPESHFTDEHAGALRAETYRRLRRHWQFINSLRLFEIKDNKRFGVHIYGNRGAVRFITATSLYHPSTVTGSLLHDGSGPEPGLRDANGKWDLSSHSSRISLVTEVTLNAWKEVQSLASTPAIETKMLFVSGKAADEVLRRVFTGPRLRAANSDYSTGFVEGSDNKTDGSFDVSWGPAAAWREAVLQGTFLHVHRPFYKFPNSTMKNNLDTTVYDLEGLDAHSMPTTSFQPAVGLAEYHRRFGLRKDGTLASNTYRIAWRAMADLVGQRTMMSAILPPGATHVDGIYSMSFTPDAHRSMLLSAGYLGALPIDFVIRSSPKSTIRSNVIDRLPVPQLNELSPMIELRVLRLNALTTAYSSLWSSAYSPEYLLDDWTGGIDYMGRRGLREIGSEWEYQSGLRRDADRRQAMLELDVLVSMSLGISVESLVSLYRMYFPVLVNSESRSVYDANGRLVPNTVLTVWRKKGDAMTENERTATNASGNTYAYEFPYVTLDREADMRQAYSHFERVLEQRA
jgi:hypothetical protein